MHLTPERAMAKVSEDSRATWSVADEEALIAFLWTCQAEAGDGTNFKAATWTAAVAHLATLGLKSGVKRAASIKNKLLTLYFLISLFIHIQLGLLRFSPELGFKPELP